MYKIKYCAFISYSLCLTYKDEYIYILNLKYLAIDDQIFGEL